MCGRSCLASVEEKIEFQSCSFMNMSLSQFGLFVKELLSRQFGSKTGFKDVDGCMLLALCSV